MTIKYASASPLVRVQVKLPRYVRSAEAINADCYGMMYCIEHGQYMFSGLTLRQHTLKRGTHTLVYVCIEHEHVHEVKNDERI